MTAICLLILQPNHSLMNEGVPNSIVRWKCEDEGKYEEETEMKDKKGQIVVKRGVRVHPW